MKYSEIESKRFGKNIYRSESDDIEPSMLRRGIIDNHIDILILRVPTSTVNNHHKLDAVGFPYLHTDTLVTYSANLLRTEIARPRNYLELEELDTSRKSVLGEMIQDIFIGYRNHYASNPYLDATKIIDGFTEWAESYVGFENKISWVVKKEGVLVGFATCSFDEQSRECTGVLYGVLPDFAGKGIYSDIIRLTQQYFKERGFATMWVSTQVQNYAVQKSWIKEGFTLRKTVETYHINAMLTYTLTSEKVLTFSVNSSDIDEYIRYSGDNNRLHSDIEFAKSQGFSNRITHGMILLSKISHFFGVEFPGVGTIFVGNKNLFLLPVYPDLDYRLVYSTSQITNSGMFDVVVKIFNSHGALCFVSYNKLRNKAVAEDYYHNLNL